jgi:hypothetical protein
MRTALVWNKDDKQCEYEVISSSGGILNCKGKSDTGRPVCRLVHEFTGTEITWGGFDFPDQVVEEQMINSFLACGDFTGLPTSETLAGCRKIADEHGFNERVFQKLTTLDSTVLIARALKVAEYKEAQHAHTDLEK